MVVNPPVSIGDFTDENGSGSHQTEVQAGGELLHIDSVNYLVTACSNQAAGVKDLFDGEWVKYQIVSTYFHSGSTPDSFMDFMSGTFFYGDKSYKDLLNSIFHNPETISGTFTFNYRGYIDVGRFDPQPDDICDFYRFEWSDSSGAIHKSVIPSDGENHDVQVTHLVLSKTTLSSSWAEDGDLPINTAFIRISPDFHLMWIFTPSSLSSL